MGFVRPPPLVLFAAAILLGRVTGLLREIILANALGASRTVDLLVLSLTLPDLLANVLFVSGFSVALVPHLRMLSPQHQAECFSGLLVRVMPVMCLIAFVGAFFADALVHLLAPGLVPLTGRESLPIQVSILSLPLVVLSGLLVAAMMARDSFVYGGLGTAVLNSGVILGILAGAYWVDPLLAVPLGLLGG
ncbi:MAG: hypothetical protein EBS77_10150, partial [Gammaproteobacteria bacterium]|nr:hypothetical protein [Gammaproteobacteria bacterium]